MANLLLEKSDIEEAIKANKHRIYNVPVTITPRDFVIAKAQCRKISEFMESHQHINMSKEWCELRDILKFHTLPTLEKELKSE